MKATAKSLLQRALKRKGDIEVMADMIIGTPKITPVAESRAYLDAYTMINKGQGGTEGMPASQRKLALDAMVRLAETQPGHMEAMLAEAGALGAEPLRHMAMTLMCVERSHRRREGARA